MHFFFRPEVLLVWTSILKTAVLLGVVLFLVSYSVYAERKVSAFIQDRLGPNRVGVPFTNLHVWGLGQPIADAIKLLLKENFVPASANKFFYCIAPLLAMIPPILVLAVLPFGSTLFGQKMVIADINIGILYVLAVASLSVYGVVLAGWASNSKYPFLGGIRSSSQMISYELALGLSVIPIFLIIGSLNLSQIVEYQVKNGWMIAPWWPKGFSIHQLLQGNFQAVWESFHAGFSLKKCILAGILFLSFLIFMVAMFAETNRLPFDLPEAEQELVGGYHTEYSSMGFALFFLGEYAAMIAGAGVIVTLFLGGWSLPFIPNGTHGLFWGLINILVFFAKVAAILFFFIWVRWTLPRFRYDQLMKLGWYYLFEIALVNIFITAFILALFGKIDFIMPLIVKRPQLTLAEKFFLPAILAGLAITWKHFKNSLFGKTRVTMQYPEERWDAQLPSYYRGAPTLVTDEWGKERCVACQLCEFICPPQAIAIQPEEIPLGDRWGKVEKRPKAFDIDMIRCIYCGLCEEVCPEQAIFLLKDYSFTGYSRSEMVHDKEKLYELGGMKKGLVFKWNEKK